MNLDFHYYGTYYAARKAGFARGPAYKIAWAAEMVDELNEDVAKEYKSFLGSDHVITVQNSVKRNWDSKDQAFNRPLQQAIRGIWVPFHFLPGHLDDKNAGWNEIRVKEKRKGDTSDISKHSVQYDDVCLKLRCAPYSSTVNELLRYFKKDVLDKRTNNLDNESLYAMGICMHVLADTWAHNHFCGLPSYVVNKADLVAPVLPAEVKDSFLDRQRLSFIKNNLLFPAENACTYNGHAQLGYIPDYSFLSYMYYPRFADPFSPTYNPDLLVTRVNFIEFRDALLGMMNALSYFKSTSVGESCDLTKRGQFYTDANNAMNQVLCQVPDNDPEEKADYVNFAIKKWTEFLEAEWKEEPIIHFNNNVGVIKEIGDGKLTYKYELQKFAKLAKKYRNHMYGYLNDQLSLVYSNNPLQVELADRCIYDDKPIITFDYSLVQKGYSEIGG